MRPSAPPRRPLHTPRWIVVAISLCRLSVTGPLVARAESPPPSDVERRLEELESEVKRLKKQQQAEEPPTLLAGWRNGFFLASADRQFLLNLGGYMQADTRSFFNNQDSSDPSQFTFRRVRLDFNGTIFRHFDFRILPDFAGSKLVLFDAYLDVNYFRAAELRIGKFKPPVGLERLQRARMLLFVERGLPTNLVPTRDLGIQLFGTLLDGSVAYAGGIFNGVPDRGNGDSDANSDKDFAGRVFVRPFRNTGISILAGLGAGASGTYGREGGSPTAPDLPVYLSAGQSTLFRYVSGSPASAANTALAAGPHARFSPQGYYHYGPFGLLGEWATSRQRVSLDGSATTLVNTAWQLAASYVLTGEAASYGGVVPRRPFDPWHDAWGAFEVVARHGELDIDDDAFAGKFADPTRSVKRASEWVAGVNWYLNTGIKLVVDYADTDFAGGAAGGDRRPERVILTRVQLSL